MQQNRRHRKHEEFAKWEYKKLNAIKSLHKIRNKEIARVAVHRKVEEIEEKDSQFNIN